MPIGAPDERPEEELRDPGPRGKMRFAPAVFRPDSDEYAPGRAYIVTDSNTLVARSQVDSLPVATVARCSQVDALPAASSDAPTESHTETQGDDKCAEPGDSGKLTHGCIEPGDSGRLIQTHSVHCKEACDAGSLMHSADEFDMHTADVDAGTRIMTRPIMSGRAQHPRSCDSRRRRQQRRLRRLLGACGQSACTTHAIEERSTERAHAERSQYRGRCCNGKKFGGRSKFCFVDFNVGPASALGPLATSESAELVPSILAGQSTLRMRVFSAVRGGCLTLTCPVAILAKEAFRRSLS